MSYSLAIDIGGAFTDAAQPPRSFGWREI